MKLLFSLSLKEIFRHPWSSLLFFFNIAIGLSSLIILENVKISFNQALNSRSRHLLGADLAVRGRRKFDEDKKQKLFKYLEAESEVTTRGMFSMVKFSGTSRLVWLSEYRLPYPYYGGLKLRSLRETPEAEILENEVWVYPETMIQMQLDIGDEIVIGQKKFVIGDVIVEDSSQTFEMGSVAPKMFISTKGLEGADLIKKGSTVWYRSYFKFKQLLTFSQLEDVTDIVDDTALRVITPDKASQQVGRVINYLSDFLGLVSLVALFLSLVGIFYLYRSHLSSKRKVYGILKASGLTSVQILQIQAMSLAILAFIGTMGAIFFGWGALPFLSDVLKMVIPFNLEFGFYSRPLVLGLTVGLVGTLLVALPLLGTHLKEKTVNLFQEGQDQISRVSKTRLLLFVPLVLFFAILSVSISNSIRNGLIFMSVFFILTIIIFPLLVWVLSKLESSIKFKDIEKTLSLRYLARYRLSTVSIFLALFFGSLLTTLIPSLQKTLQTELDGGLKGTAPSLFLFDIQDEQVAKIKSFAKKNKFELAGLSPMVRGRLVKINGKELKLEVKEANTREQEQERRSRNRGINLSYSLQEGDQTGTIIKGKLLKRTKEGEVPGLSLEQRYAYRLGLDIGDQMTFEIMGIEIVGKVENIRRVRWTSFQPNFFIKFAPGVLEDAPKTFLAAIPSMDVRKKLKIQNDIIETYNNISVVDLDRVVSRIKDILAQMSGALGVMSLVVVFVGLMVVFALINNQFSNRKKDVVLLKVLGASHGRLTRMVLREFLILSLLATGLGSILGLFLSCGASYYLFEGLWVIDWTIPSKTIGLMTLLCVAVAYIAAKRTLRTPAMATL